MNSRSFSLKPPILAKDLLLKPSPERHWVVPGTFERGDRLIVTGSEGDGKSTLLRQMGIQIALGIHPFTYSSFEPPTVLLMDLENSEEQIKEEIRKIAERAEVDLNENLSVTSWPSGVDFTRFDYEAEVRSIIDAIRPDLVIGGPLYKMTEQSLADETASRQVSAALDRLREDFGATLILEAHQVNEATAFDATEKDPSLKWKKNRQARPFGASLWRRWPEFGYCLFHGGTWFNWRGDRQPREWPKKFMRDGERWLWQVDDGHCPICRIERPEGRDIYCSDRCRNTAKARRHRAKTLF